MNQLIISSPVKQRIHNSAFCAHTEHCIPIIYVKKENIVILALLKNFNRATFAINLSNY
jgi:hypothetical protein